MRVPWGHHPQVCDSFPWSGLFLKHSQVQLPEWVACQSYRGMTRHDCWALHRKKFSSFYFCPNAMLVTWLLLQEQPGTFVRWWPPEDLGPFCSLQSLGTQDSLCHKGWLLWTTPLMGVDDILLSYRSLTEQLLAPFTDVYTETKWQNPYS